MNIIWVLVSSNSRAEAEKIGGVILKERLCACYSLYKKFGSFYFWPPKANRVEYSGGPLLVLETLPKNYPKITKRVRQLHSDKVPFIGKITVGQVDRNFYDWLSGELKP